MKQSFFSLVLLLLTITHSFGSPFHHLEDDDDDEDCYMEWMTIYGDERLADLHGAPTGAVNPMTGLFGPTAATPASSTSVAAFGNGASDTLAATETYVASSPMISNAYATPPVPVASSSAVMSSSPAASSAPPSTGGSTSLTPGGKKAGISGFEGVTTQSGWSQFANLISWYSDYTPSPQDSGSVKGVGMVNPLFYPFRIDALRSEPHFADLTTSSGATAAKAPKTLPASPPSPPKSPPQPPPLSI